MEMRVLLIDAFNLIRRIYEVHPHSEGEALQPDVILRVVASLRRVLKRFSPSHACCVFDSQEKTWRHALYPAYKENRKPTPQAMLDGLPDIKAAFLEAGVQSITVPGYEADDVIATLSHHISNAGGKVWIVSTDKGYLQLLGDNVEVFDQFNNRSLTREWVEEKYGVKCGQLLDYWALMGDSGNNIKGIPKVGPKTARSLLSTYKTLEQILQNPPTTTVGGRISAHLHEAKVCYQLATLKADVEIGTNLKQLRYHSDSSRGSAV